MSATFYNQCRKHLERRGVPEVALALLTFAIYARSLFAGFVYDDHQMVEMPMAFNWTNIVRAFSEDLSTDHASNFYRPLTALWQSLVAQLAGSSTWGWHLASVLLHVLCVVLVFRLACALLNDRTLAALAAALFALHPTHVENVTWVSDSGDLLLGAFLLFSALAIVRWARTEQPGWWIAAWAAAAACCFVKETGVIVPLLLLVLIFSVERKVNGPAIVVTAISFFATSFAFLVLRSQVLHGFAHPLSKASNLQMALTLPSAMWFYLSHLLFPVRLGPFYPILYLSTWQSRDFWLPLLLLAAALAALAWLYTKLDDRCLFYFCAVWAVAPLLAPLYLKLFLNFELVHDRYLYLPSIALGVALARLCQKAGARRQSSAVVALVAILALAIFETVLYQGVWRSDTTMFERAVELTPGNARAWVNLGVEYLQAGDLTKGSEMMRRALVIQPDNAFAWFDLGNVALRSGDSSTAAGYLRKAVALEPRPNWLVLLGGAQYQLNQLPEAAWSAQQAAAQNPSEPGVHLLLGAIRLKQGEPDAAAQDLSLELQLHPGNPNAEAAMREAQAQIAKGSR